jgi:hypothetical protein
MRSGFLPKTDKQAADDLIAGTDRDPTKLATLSDVDPDVDPDAVPAAA